MIAEGEDNHSKKHRWAKRVWTDEVKGTLAKARLVTP